uniref:peptidyl-tRNA hydrolase n=1 Tax=Graphocephala atropunctata TaxID=36148 RepID=A0A1B6KXY7_9HEMI
MSDGFSASELIEGMDTTKVAVVVTSFAVGVVAALLVKRGLLLGAAVATGDSWRDMKMVMVVRSDLQIGRNKAATQCAHAAINCYKRALTDAPKELKRWERQGQTKVVVKAPGEAELIQVAENAQAEGLVAVVIHDADSATVLGIGPGPTVLVDKVAGHLKLF